jgi:hypothetical protein
MGELLIVSTIFRIPPNLIAWIINMNTKAAITTAFGYWAWDKDSSMSSVRKICALICLVFFVIIPTSACSNPIARGDVENNSIHSQKTRDARNSVYFRIQADYELIETGEALNFDFIVSCYNREVTGSFHGILKPTTMFKATSTGAAVAISPPQHYCLRGSDNLVREYDLMKMPILAWYPDVADLSFALIYMTNDAYTGPQAKIKFKRYDVSSTDRNAFIKWEAETIANYKQIGAIPGPFGCAAENVSVLDPYFCGFEATRKRNNGSYLVIADRMNTVRHVHAIDIPPDLVPVIKSKAQISGDFYCDYSVIPETGARREKLFDILLKGEPPLEGKTRKRVLDFFKKFIAFQSRSRMLTNPSVYLDPESLLFPDKNVVIREVYPVVNFVHPLSLSSKEHSALNKDYETLVSKVFQQEHWRGFAIDTTSALPSQTRVKGLEPPKYNGSYNGVLFLNETLVCEKLKPRPAHRVTDLSQKKIFTIK